MRHTRALALAVVAGTAAAVGYSGSAYSSDHVDSPAVVAAPLSDINDVYAWMVDANTVALALSVGGIGNVTATTKFDPTVQYVFHTASAAASTLPASVPTTSPVDVIATFDTSATQNFQLWVGTSEYVEGPVGSTTGVTSADGTVKVFTGVRADPFFFNFTGFSNAVATVKGATGLTFTDAGCPLINAATSDLLIHQLGSSSVDGGAAPVDNFATNDVLAIVVTLPKSLLTAGGPLVTVWGATYSTAAAPADAGTDAAEDATVDAETDAKADSATDAGGQ